MEPNNTNSSAIAEITTPKNEISNYTIELKNTEKLLIIFFFLFEINLCFLSLIEFC